MRENAISLPINEIKKILKNQFQNWDQLRHEARRPLLFVGPSGWGKSSIVVQTSKELGIPMLHLMGSLLRNEHVSGIPARTSEETAKFLILDHLKPIFRTKEPFILFIDELGQAAPEVQAGLQSVIYDKSINGEKIPDHVRIVAATNRPQDNAEAVNLLGPLLARTTRLDVLPDYDAFMSYAYSQGLPPAALAACYHNEQWFRDHEVEVGSFENVPSGRAIFATAFQLESMIKSGAIDLDTEMGHNIATNIAIGNMGPDGANMIPYWKYASRLPRTSEIVNSPSTCPIPEKLDERWVLVSRLATRTKPEHAIPVIDYVFRKDGGEVSFGKEAVLYFLRVVEDYEMSINKSERVFQGASKAAFHMMNLITGDPDFRDCLEYLKTE